MKKKYIFIIYLVSCVFITWNNFSEVNAEKIEKNEALEIVPSYINFSVFNKNIAISNGKATCTVNYNSSNSKSKMMTVTLQKKQSGSWKDIKTWAHSSAKTGLITFSESYNVTSGYEYRIKCKLEVLDAYGKVTESVTEYSSVKKY